MSRFVIIDALQYAFSFSKDHVWDLMRILLVFMAISIALGLVIAGSSIVLLQALSNNIWMMVVFESPFLAVAGYIFFGIWNVSFITYLLALERTGSALVKKHLKKSWSTRVVKIIAFDLVVVLFVATIVLMVGSFAVGAWWLGGMHLALWLRALLAIIGIVLSVGFLYLYMRLFLTKIIIADTDADIFTALATSWSATNGWFWRLMVMIFVVGLVGGFVTLITSQFSNLMVLLMGGSVVGKLVGNIVQVFGALFSMVFSPIVVLYYYNYLKVAKSLVVGK